MNKEEEKIKKENEEIAHRIICIRNREEKIKKLNSFFKDYFEYDNELKPSTTTCITRKGAILVSNPIKERRAILRKHCILTVMINKTAYFLFYSNPNLEKLFLYDMQSLITRKLTIKYDDTISYFFNSKKDWNGNADVIKKEFAQLKNQDYTLYNPAKVPTAQLPVPKDNNGKRTAEFFLNIFGNKTINKFFINCFIYHIAHRSGVFDQVQIKKVRIKNSDLKKLFPKNFRIKELLNHVNSGKTLFLLSAQKVKGGFYDFTLNTELFQQHKALKIQTIKIPYKLLLKAFSAKGFNHTGLRYFLLIMFGYHLYTNPKITYKISTIIRLAQLNTTKGAKHLLKTLNNPLKFLKENKIIRNFQEITLEDIKADKSITIYLNNI